MTGGSVTTESIEDKVARLPQLDWGSVLKNGWPDEPVYFSRPFGSSLFEAQWFFEALQALRTKAESRRGIPVSIHDAAGQCYYGKIHDRRRDSGIVRYLPLATDTEFLTYTERLSSLPGMHRFSIMMDQAHAQSEPVWTMTRHILRTIFQYIPLPETRVRSDAFLGNYEKTNFGVHLDNLNNLMFMVSGSRSIRLWPGDSSGKIFSPSGEGTLDYDEYLDSSQLFTLHEGDILFWPADYYHVGEGDGSHSVSYNIDFMCNDEGEDWTTELAQQSMSEMVSNMSALLAAGRRKPERYDPSPDNSSREPASEYYKSLLTGAAAAMESGFLSSHFLKKWVSRQSCLALDEGPAFQKVAHIDDLQLFALDSYFPIPTLSDQNYVYMGCNGEVVVSKLDSSWQRLITLLNSGDEFTVAELAKQSFANQGASLEDWTSEVEALIRKLLQFRVVWLRQ